MAALGSELSARLAGANAGRHTDFDACALQMLDIAREQRRDDAIGVRFETYPRVSGVLYAPCLLCAKLLDKHQVKNRST